MQGSSLPPTAELTQRFQGGVRLAGPEGLAALSIAAEVGAERPSRFRAVMRATDVGSVRVSRLRTSAVSVVRTPRWLGDGHCGHLSVFVVRSGGAEVEQQRARRRVEVGEAAFVNFAAPFTVSLSGRGDYVFAYVPHAILAARSVDVRALAGAVVPAEPLTSILGAVLEQFAEADLRPGASAEVALLEHAVVDLCVAVIRQAQGSSGEADAVRSRNRARALEFVENNFTDPTLTVARVAAAMNVSPRYLHKLFESEPHSVYELIRRRRISRGLEMLTDPDHTDLTVGQVAVRSGFVGPTQFGRAVRDLTGSTPRAIRRQGAVP
ncbi:helix-turn-helix domain-containing protein [Rhodococcus olei]